MNNQRNCGIRVFISYAHQDEDLRKDLDRALGALEKEGIVEVWSDKSLKPGDSWEQQIEREIEKADLILLLVSSDFLKSTFCYKKEMRRAMERHENGSTCVVPIILRDCYWEPAPFGRLQKLPRGMNPIASYAKHRRDAVWRNVAQGIHKVAKELLDGRVHIPVITREPLPPRPAVFIGREQELAQLVGALTQDNPGPCVVLGGPGMGKSTLCIEALNHPKVQERYGAQRYYVNLENVVDADSMIAKITSTLGIVPGAAPLSQVVNLLDDVNSLLVLDNAEICWWDDTGNTETTLTLLSNIQSSRSTFIGAFRGGRLPLGPRWSSRIRLQPLNDEESRALFLAWTYNEQDQAIDYDSLDYILRALDGMPLAIVLMARRAQTLSLRDLKRGWERHLWQILRDGNARDRNLNLEVSLEVSISDPRMDDNAKALLSLLGLLPTGIESEDLDVLLPDTVLHAKDRLLAIGIAIMTGDVIRLLGPVREYIKVTYPPQKENLSKLVNHYFLIAHESYGIGWKGGRKFYDRLLSKATRIETLILFQLECDDTIGALNAVSAAVAYGRFQRFSGVGSYALLEKALKIANDQNNCPKKAECYRILGSIKRTRSDPTESRYFLEQARKIYERYADYLGIAHCLRRLGDVDRDRFEYSLAKNKYMEAITYYEKAQKICVEEPPTSVVFKIISRQKEISRGKADCIFRLGVVKQDEYLEHNAAAEHFREALNIHSVINNELGQAHCLKRLGDVAIANFSEEEAKDCYVKAERLYEGIPFLIGTADCTYSLADWYLKRGDSIQAEPLYSNALELYRRTSSEHGKANCLYSLADIAVMKLVMNGKWSEVGQNNEVVEAEERYVSAQRSYAALKDDIGKANCLSGLSDIEQIRRNEEKSTELFKKACETARTAFGRKENVEPAITVGGRFVRRWRR